MAGANPTGETSGCLFDRLGPGPLLIAHRGDRARRPENTLCAFRACLGRSPMIELDVQLCADGVPVVIHDDQLQRTSDAARLEPILSAPSLLVRDWSLDRLRCLDLGSWFLAADPFGALRNGRVDRLVLQTLMPQPILTLEELLTWAIVGKMALNIELKDQHDRCANERLAAAAVRLVRASGAVHLVVFSSFNHDLLRACRGLDAEIPVAALQGGTHPPDLVAYLRALGACAYHPADNIVDASLVRLLRTSSLHVNVFTVNDPMRQHQLFAWGATGVFTDWLGPT
ncbi:MAG: glycerophosphodiester phosphodiesterase family protein [Desulfobulbus sp.]|jgi:glycerophosphoryl diester phosphodiesterase|nr:glycerophosphodiester phosphodiesterase family protein [Desulfobulbus sp.]